MKSCSPRAHLNREGRIAGQQARLGLRTLCQLFSLVGSLKLKKAPWDCGLAALQMHGSEPGIGVISNYK